MKIDVFLNVQSQHFKIKIINANNVIIHAKNVMVQVLLIANHVLPICYYQIILVENHVQ